MFSFLLNEIKFFKSMYKMTSNNQIELSNFIKSVHDDLRKKVKEKGPDLAWNEHIENSENLEKYSKYMKELAVLWEQNFNEDNYDIKKKCAQSRIHWITKEIFNYFNTEFNERRKKEIHLLNIWCNEIANIEKYKPKISINVLDVGSCYNPFKEIEKFNVTAIDLYPNKELEVFKCDFLNVNISEGKIIGVDKENYEIKSLPLEFYECVVFSLYLEYIPTSLQRIESCKKAYKLLRTEGILLIITPDSDHVNKNAKLMKNWRYTLGKLGFLRIKFEKLNHLTCMVYRKSINSEISNHWSDKHKEEYMKFELEIPQDKNC